LTGITGIGENTADKLLKHFKSVKNIKSASEDELNAVIGSSRTKALLEWMEKNKGA
jgi:excinuclease ABC subunit C